MGSPAALSGEATAMARAFAKALPAVLVAIYRQRGSFGLREFVTVEEAAEWVDGEHGVAWLHLFDRTTGKLVLTARPPLRHEPPVRLRPDTHYLPFGADEKGRYRFELHAEMPPFRVLAGGFASRAERDEAAEALARLLHLPLDLDVPEERA
jgi:hypothetical protein